MTPTLFGVAVCLLGIVATARSAIYLQLVCCLFGATAALVLGAVGGATIRPETIFLPFLGYYAWKERGPNALHRVPKAGVWLAAFAAWGAVSAMLVPRLFAGVTEIYTIDRAISTRDALYPLRPVSGNITQTAYALGGVLVFFAMRSLLIGRSERLRDFSNAVLLLGTLNAACAVISAGAFYLGLPNPIDVVRTANYTIYDSYAMADTGFVRIQGTFSETSTFSAFTLPLFAFSFNLWVSSRAPLWSGGVAMVSLLLLLVSTSGTAYGGLAGYLLFFTVVATWRALTTGHVTRLRELLLIAGTVVVFAGAAFVLELDAAQQVIRFVEQTVFDKFESRSGESRGRLNEYAWQNFLDTYGVGVGMGSARASTYALLLLSNVGLLGTALFVGFLVTVLSGVWKHETRGQHPTVTASRHAVAAAFAAALTSGANVDLGMAFYCFAAAATVPLVRSSATEVTSERATTRTDPAGSVEHLPPQHA